MWNRFRQLPSPAQLGIVLGLAGAMVAGGLVAAERDPGAPAVRTAPRAPAGQIVPAPSTGLDQSVLNDITGSLTEGLDVPTASGAVSRIRARVSTGSRGRSSSGVVNNPIGAVSRPPTPVNSLDNLSAAEAERLAIRETSEAVMSARLVARQQPSFLCGFVFGILGRLFGLFNALVSRFPFLAFIFRAAFAALFGLLRLFGCPLPSPAF